MEWAHRLQSEDPGLEIVHPHAAGIDVGNPYSDSVGVDANDQNLLQRGALL